MIAAVWLASTVCSALWCGGIWLVFEVVRRRRERAVRLARIRFTVEAMNEAEHRVQMVVEQHRVHLFDGNEFRRRIAREVAACERLRDRP